MKHLLTEKNTSLMVEVLTLVLVLFVGYVLFLNNSFDLGYFNNGDVHRGFQRGVDLLNGVNSYLAFNPVNMLTQEKVPGFFPLYFVFMAVVTKLSQYSFVLFIDNLRYIIFVCYSALGLLIYKHLRSNSKLLAVFGMVLYMFNRWTLQDVLALKQESYVLLVLALSLVLLRKHKAMGFLLYGVATALKHLTLLVFPVYVVELLAAKTPAKKYVLYFALFLAPIIVPSLPYLIQTPTNFVNAILYNVTRESETTSDTTIKTGFDKVLVLYNQDTVNTGLLLLPRLPMVVTLLLFTVVFFKRKVNMWQYCALTYAVFIGFNPTLFDQYFMWFFFFFSMSLKPRLKNQL